MRGLCCIVNRNIVCVMCVRAKWVVLWSLWAARLVRQPTATVRVSNGLLRGAVAHDGSYVQYNGIPFGSVTDETKFQAPGPEPKWDGIYDAIHEEIRCNQQFSTNLAIGRRDCLTLNIYTPFNTDPGDKLAVMFFIHGGGFFQGSGSSFFYGPRYLVSKGVILVTINYRLNIQGFLCLGIKEAPGNAALKDMVAALKWVQRNIASFGGDPDNVTIFGESAGAASVSFLVLSPMAKGLFHKAITQSGSSLAPFGLQFKPIFLASLLAKVMGFISQDPVKLYEYFMTKSDDELILTRVPRKEGHVIISEILYTPCVEKVIEGVEPFLIQSPQEALSKGDFNKVPMIIGSNTQEGIMILEMDNSTMRNNIKIEKSLPKNLNITSQEEVTEIVGNFKKIYMGDGDSFGDLVSLSKWYGEPYLNYPSLEETELILKSSEQPIYNYLFNYSGWRNLPKLGGGSAYKDVPGATHADDLFYMFSQEWLSGFFENKMIERITTLWTNFAKYGDPTPEATDLLPVKWYPTNLTTPMNFVLDEAFSTVPLWYNEAVKYWKQVYQKYRRRYVQENIG